MSLSVTRLPQHPSSSCSSTSHAEPRSDSSPFSSLEHLSLSRHYPVWISVRIQRILRLLLTMNIDATRESGIPALVFSVSWPKAIWKLAGGSLFIAGHSGDQGPRINGAGAMLDHVGIKKVRLVRTWSPGAVTVVSLSHGSQRDRVSRRVSRIMGRELQSAESSRYKNSL